MSASPVAAESALAGGTPEQDAAIEARDRDVFLEAGAGTGKTRVLVDRYCAAVCDDLVPVDAVLAFTFTERAAAELADRIRREIRRRAEAERDPDRRIALRDAGRAVESGWISTIHGFCQRLLRAHPVAAGLDPGFRVIDASEAERLAATAFEAAFEDFLAGDSVERARLAAAFRVPGLRGMVTAAHDELRSMGRESPQLPPPPPPADAEALLARLGAAAEAALAETDGAPGPHAARYRDKIEASRSLAAAGGGRLPGSGELERLRFSSTAKRFAVPVVVAWQEALAAAIVAVAERESEDAYESIRELLGLFDRRYEALKSARSGLDFEDLQLGAVRLLREHDAIGERYRERFRHILVDEFQDTNALQLMLIEQLRGPETRLFAVGDEFQSIYGFRHADLEVFRAERERFEARPGGEAGVLRLSGNFRSAPEVVAAVNALGGSLLPGHRPLTVGAAPDRAQEGEPAVELLLTDERRWGDEGIDLDPPTDATTPARVLAEARLLALRLRELADAGESPGEMVVLLRATTHVAAYEEALHGAGLDPYVVGGHGYWSQQQVEDLRQLLGAIANPLDDECLLGALASPACGVLPDTLWLLRLATGGGRHLWPRIERLTAAEPASRGDGQLTLDGDPGEDAGDDHGDPGAAAAIPAEEVAKLSLFRERLDSLRELGGRLGLEQLVERAASDFGYDLAALAKSRGRRRLANVRKLMRLAREYEAHEGRDLRGFLEFVAERTGRDVRDGEAATEAEHQGGVRVMTVHSAKGLEFPIVAVADLGRNLLAGGRPPSIRIAAAPDRAELEDAAAAPVLAGIRLARLGRKAIGIFGYDRLELEAAKADREETCRLAYVAATRAKRRLILSGSLNLERLDGDCDPETLAMRPIAERLARDLGVSPDRRELSVAAPAPRPGASGEYAAGRIAVRISRASPEAAAELLAAGRRPERQRQPVSVGAPPLGRPAAAGEEAVSRLSYSALSDYERCGYRFYVERVLGLGEGAVGAAGAAAAERARRFGLGNAAHGLLDWSARNRWAAPGRTGIEAALAAEGLAADAAEVARVGDLVGRWLDSPLCAELGGRDVRLRPEVPFTIALGGALLRGKLDLLAELPGGERLVVDYKTNALDGGDPAEAMAGYEGQRFVYAVAAAFGANGPVRTAYVFLEAADRPVLLDFDADAIAAARGDLERLVARIRGGRFEVADAPHAALCHDCPARERLCSWGEEMTLRPAP